MFREMRRKERQIPPEEAEKILRQEKAGVLSVNGDHGYPYGVPMNYVYVEGKIYLHSTSDTSHKLDRINSNNKICLTIIARQDLVVEDFAVHFGSIIVFGKARIINDPNEKAEDMRKMMENLAPGQNMGSKAIAHCKGNEHTYAIIEIIPEHITGKAGR